MKRPRLMAAVGLAGLILGAGPPALAGDPVKGAGSTFAQKIIQL